MHIKSCHEAHYYSDLPLMMNLITYIDQWVLKSMREITDRKKQIRKITQRKNG